MSLDVLHSRAFEQMERQVADYKAQRDVAVPLLSAGSTTDQRGQLPTLIAVEDPRVPWTDCRG